MWSLLEKNTELDLRETGLQKGLNFLGIKAVIAESFERIHRSNLVGMGVLPLQLLDISKEKIDFNGDEIFI